MRDSQDLFDLIHTLSGPEKRYFRLMSGTYAGEKYYTRVFDVLLRQKEYDENKLREKLGDKKIIRLLPRIKTYLKAQLLRCIRDCSESVSAIASLSRKVQEAQALFARGLYPQCTKLVEALKKEADKYESLTHRLDLILLEWNLRLATGVLKQQDALLEEYQEIIQEMDRIRQYRKISNTLYPMLIHQGMTRTPRMVQKLEALMRHPLLKDENAAMYYLSRYNFYQIYQYYHKIKNQRDKVYYYLQQLLKLMEAKPYRTVQFQMDYLSVLINTIDILVLLGRFEECPAYLHKLFSIRPVTMPARIRINVFGNLYQQVVYLTSGEFSKATASVDNVLVTIKTFGDKISPSIKQAFYHNISQAYFGTGDYAQALRWINTGLDFKEGYSDNTHAFGKIYALIIHYEKGNQDILPYLLRSTYRYLYQKDRLYRYESIILRFIRKLVQVPTERELIPALKALKELLDPLKKDDFEKSALEYFDIISWLQSKIEKRPFAGIVKEKAGAIPGDQ